jgi:hypothetical protein
MKKFVVLLAVVAMTCFSAMAFAADVTVGGSYEIRSRNFVNTNVQTENLDAVTTGDHKDTQNRIRIDVNAKAGDVKGKLQLQNDFAKTWGDANVGGFETTGGNSTTGTALHFREAWVSFNLPFAPINVTGGHQLLTLGNGWFFRSMHYGSDAWVIANQTGPNTVAFANIKVTENNAAYADDTDAYTILDVFKLSDTMTVGADLSNVHMRAHTALDNNADLYNLGVNFNGKFGPMALKAEVDLQAGKEKNADLFLAPGVTHADAKFKGNQVVIQGAIGLDPITVNFTVARGSGPEKDQVDYNQLINFLDVDPHYTFLYEYKVNTAAGAKNTGFSNTTAVGAGVSAAVSKSVTVGADFWLLKATEAVALNGAVVGGQPATSRDAGMELDLKVNWKLYDNLAWNWTFGLFQPGNIYDRMVNGVATEMDDVMGAQGVLAFKF